MSGTTKKNLKNMCLQEKLNVLDKLDKGVPKKVIAETYDITYRIISSIQKKREEIEKLAEFTKTRINIVRKVRIPRTKLLNNLNRTLSNSTVLQNSDSICTRFTISAPYSKKDNDKVLYSNNMNSINGIQTSNEIHEKIAFNQKNMAEKFINAFRTFVTENGYSMNNIYNADEAIIHWRTLNFDKYSERKRNREHITALFCANATATHKLPLLIVEKTPEHEWIEDVNKLPLIYKSQSNSWIDRNIFQEWYENYFIPLVKAEQKTKGRCGKVLLLLDNAPSHPSKEYFNSKDKNFQVLYIPLIISSMIQPMEREVISTIKELYIDSVKRQILGQDYNEGYEDYLIIFNKVEGCNLLASAWDNIPSSMIIKAWKELIDSNFIKTEIIEEYDINEHYEKSDDILTLFGQNVLIKQESLDLDNPPDQNIITMNDYSFIHQNTAQEYVNVNEDFNVGDLPITFEQAKEALRILYSFMKQQKNNFSHVHVRSLNKIETIINSKCTKNYDTQEENIDILEM